MVSGAGWLDITSIFLGGAGQIATGLLGGSEEEERAKQQQALANLEAWHILQQMRERLNALSREHTRKQEQRFMTYVSAGIDPSRGTPVDVLAEAAVFDAMESEWVKYQYLMSAESVRMQGEAFAQAGAVAKEASISSAISTAGVTAVSALSAYQTPPSKNPEIPNLMAKDQTGNSMMLYESLGFEPGRSMVA